MQWIYLICFILLSAGLLALFGVKPGESWYITNELGVGYRMS